MLEPSEAVDWGKQNRLINNAAAFLKYTKIDYKRIRFDIAEVYLTDFHNAKIHIIEDAFGQGSFPEKQR